MRIIGELLYRCREKGLNLNRDKLQLNRKSTSYTGHELTSSGLAIDRRKQDAIRQMPAPTNRKGVMRIIRLFTYVATFIPNFSDKIAKLRELLSRDVEFEWNEDTHGEAF